MKTDKIKRTVFLVAFFFAVLLGMLCVMGCPSTDQRSANLPLSSEPPIVNPLGPPTYIVYVKGLVCPSCAVGLKNGLMKLSFVKFIHINYKTGIALIYEKQQRDKGGEGLDKLRITKAVKDSGYSVDRFIK